MPLLFFTKFLLALPVSVPLNDCLLKEHSLQPCKGSTPEVFEQEHSFSWMSYGKKRSFKEMLFCAEITLSWGVLELKDCTPLIKGLHEHMKSHEKWGSASLSLPESVNDPFYGYGYTPFIFDSFGVFFRDENTSIQGGAFGDFCLDTNNALEIQTFFIKEEIRCKGLGRKIILHLEVFSKKQAIKSLKVLTSNLESPLFYQKVGFQQIGTFDIGENLSMYHFQKNL